MQRLFSVVGYVVLLVTPVVLLGDAVAAWPRGSLASVGLGGGLVLVGAVTATVERRSAFARLDGAAIARSDAVDAAVVTLAAGLTYVVSVHAGLGPVVASAAVGVAAGLAVPNVDTAAYCGSFVGMASPAVFPSVGPVLVAGLVAGVAFVAATASFAGFGGKLGTLALFGCVTAGVLSGVEYATAGGIPWGSVVLTVPVAAVAAVATVLLSVRFGLGSVLGSATVGLVAGLALPVVAPGVGGRLATVAFCASFVGMSSRERLSGEGRVALAGALCGLVFVVVAPALVGAGGKLGTTAFVSCVALAGGDRLVGRSGWR